MANTQCIPTPTKQAWQQRATPTTDTYKAALYTNVGTLGPTSTVYTTSGEVTGTNYTAGGVYKTLPKTNLKTPDTAVYQLSACNVKAVLVGGDATTVAEVRLVSVA